MIKFSLPSPFDPRYLQLGILATLLMVQFASISGGATPVGTACSAAACLATQAVAARILRIPFDWRSALITGLSLSLLLRTPSPLWLMVAGVIGVGSKFVLRWDGRHVFNPSAFAISVMLFSGAGVWVSPGLWSANAEFAAFVTLLAAMVLPAARRWDIAIYFLAIYGAFLAAHAHSTGEPIDQSIHALMSGSLLIFAFFMISDPPTTPRRSIGRLVFAFWVAELAYFLAFHERQTAALYLSLVALSPATLLIDRAFPGPKFAWRPAARAPSRVSNPRLRLIAIK